MKAFSQDIFNDGIIHKYTMVEIGSKKWRRTYFACADHYLISPLIHKWHRSFFKGNVNQFPRLIELSINDEKIVEFNYSEEDVEYEKADAYAEILAKQKLVELIDEEMLFSLILDKGLEHTRLIISK